MRKGDAKYICNMKLSPDNSASSALAVTFQVVSCSCPLWLQQSDGQLRSVLSYRVLKEETECNHSNPYLVLADGGRKLPGPFSRSQHSRHFPSR